MGARVTKSSSVAIQPTYEPAIDATPIKVFDGRGNLYGFSIENNDATNDIFVSFYEDSSSPTVGTGIKFEFRVPAGGNFGRDPQEIAYRFFGEDCWIAVTDARGGTGPLTRSDASGQFWFKNS